MDARIKCYRDRAARIRRKAETLTIPSIRADLRNIAAHYEEMAADLERKELKGR